MNDAQRNYGWIALGIVLLAVGALLGGRELALVLLLFAAGLLLLLVEMFFLPGFTVAGVIGVVAIMAAIAVMVVSGGIGTRQIGGLVLASAGAAFLARHIPRLPAVEGLLRMNPRMWDVAVPERYPDRAKVGDIGVVVTPLRLGGKPDSVTKSSRFNLKGSSLTSELTWK